VDGSGHLTGSIIVGCITGMEALGQQDRDPGSDRDRHQRADQS
jgi:hypothetical protein